MLIDRDALKEIITSRNLQGAEDFNRLMGDITREVVETFLEGELTSYLGYNKYTHSDKRDIATATEKSLEVNNSRNGFSKKTVKSKYGRLELSIPRDRKSDFSPQIVKKGQTDMIGLEDKVISMYARGMSTRDISSYVEEIYDQKLSPDTVSSITEHVSTRSQEWQNRPLESIYSIVYMDGIYIKVQLNGHVINTSVYNILGITLEGKKECLGLWVSDGNESSKYWLKVLNELNNRGVKDILIFSVDNLTGISEAISAVYPQSEIQKCIIHQIRNSTKCVSYKERGALCSDLKFIYNAPTEDLGILALGKLEEKWGDRYPYVISSWRKNWPELSTFYKYPPQIRRLIYTTNPIESMNSGLRKVVKTKSVFPSKDSVSKLLFLVVERMNNKWNRTLQDWHQILPQLLIYFKERVEKYL